MAARHLPGGGFSLREMRKDLHKGHCIQDAVRRHAALARHFNTPMHVVELTYGVSIRIDAEDIGEGTPRDDTFQRLRQRGKAVRRARIGL
ncbi:hypothetical protein AAFG13_17260 [Bradyrhizobium sp. B124]|uniref:hypothetical protein n=1 Tax=Bradyrhizobium sp. B124 TaxID=3140245 RepID=UPI0031834F1A